MEMRLRAPVTRGYFFLLGALRLINAASPRNIDQKKISSGTQGTQEVEPKHLIPCPNFSFILINILYSSAIKIPLPLEGTLENKTYKVHRDW